MDGNPKKKCATGGYVRPVARDDTREILVEGEEWFRSLVENAPDFIFVLNSIGKIRFINRTYPEHRKEDVIGRTIFDFVHPEYADLTREKIDAVFRTGKPLSFETKAFGPGGSSVEHENRYSPIFRKGKVVSVIGVVTDITNRKRSEEALKKSEEQFRILFEGATNPVTILDRDGTVIMVNPVGARNLGRPPAECVGRSIFDLMPLAPEPQLKLFRMVVDEGMELATEDRFDLQGGPKWFWTVHQPIVDADGRRYAVQLISYDITDKKQAEADRLELEKKVQHAQKLESLGVLAGGIAHDFNNLLMGMLGNAELALRELPPESPTRTKLQEIETAIQRAADLTSQMLAYSGKGRFVVKKLDLGALVQEMVHLLEISISKKVSLKLDFADGVPPVESDATQLRQIVMNLVTNASEAIGDGIGVISVRTGAMMCDSGRFENSILDENLAAGMYSYFEISDTGSGMDKETIAKIFDPFFTTKFTGRGLGLAAVLGIVRGHKGAITVESELGRGTRFRVLFPCTDGAPIAEPSSLPQAPAIFSGNTILLVDDEQAVRTTVTMMLQELGFVVVAAKHGEDAIEKFRANPRGFACVLLDLTMPVMDGPECFEKLCAIRPDVRVILSSGYNEPESISRASAPGIAAFIQKPYTSDQLVEKLKEALESK